MRTLVLATLAVLPALSLAACASSGVESGTAGPTSASEYDRLKRDCDARGGILVSSGRITGLPGADNICKINGPPSPTP